MYFDRIGAFTFLIFLLTLCGDIRLVYSFPVGSTDGIQSNDTSSVGVNSSAANQTTFNATSITTSNGTGNAFAPNSTLVSSPLPAIDSLSSTTNASAINEDKVTQDATVSNVTQPLEAHPDFTIPASNQTFNDTTAINSTGSDILLNNTTTLNATAASLPLLSIIEDAGLEHDSLVEPYLAETDTIISADSQRAYGPAPYEVRYHALGDDDDNFDILKHWGPYAPYFSNPSFRRIQNFRSVPERCTIKQVNLLHRDGARLPTSKNAFAQWFEAGTSERASIDHGHKITFNGPLHFLNQWTYRLGYNELTSAGIQQMFDSGIQAHYRYGGLFNRSKVAHRPVVRTLTQQRLAESAKWWARGYYGDKTTITFDLEMQYAASGYNSTLATSQACPATDGVKHGDQMMLQWINKYTTRAVKRLNHYVHNGRLTPSATFGMQALCAHETFAFGQSDFCALFSEDEWRGFEYAFDLNYQANYGFMSPSGPAQGIGWVQELVARLTSTPITDHFTTQNVTLDGNATSFPLDQAFYADFSHGSQLVSVLSAMNFTSLADVLSAKEIATSRNFIASHIVPFAARLYVELLECNEEDDVDGGDAHRHYIRTFLNDALLPMSADQGCLGRNAKRDGLCPLSSFVKHVNSVSVPKADYEHACFPQGSFKRTA
jgi:hypothetical protein